jgi:hypothetical protein
VSIEIRSYRAVFDLERRIYRVDRLRLNPGGVPVRGVVYWLAILACFVLAGALPLLGGAVRALPWYVRELLLPVASAALLTALQLEGRPFHLAAAALLRHILEPRRLAGLRPASDEHAGRRAGLRPAGRSPVGMWRPGKLLMLPDDSGAPPRRLRYSGPGAVRVSASRQVVVLERGAELRVGHAGWMERKGCVGRMERPGWIGRRERAGAR